MNTHELKCWPEYFHALVLGTKLFELRVNDRNYQRGDMLVLQEFIPCADCEAQGKVWRQMTHEQWVKENHWQECKACQGKKGTYTGQQVRAKVTFLLENMAGIVSGYVILGIQLQFEEVIQEDFSERGMDVAPATRSLMAAGLLRMAEWISLGGRWIKGGGTLKLPEPDQLHLRIDLIVGKPPERPRIKLLS